MINRVKTISGIFSVLLGFVFSYFWAHRSMNGEEFVLIDKLLSKNYREIAAVKKSLGLSTLTDHLLISSSPLKALSLAKLTKTENFFQITLGHFSTKDRRGEDVFACQVYDKVTLTYESTDSLKKDGAATTPQTMVLEMKCKMAENDVKHLAPIHLAPGTILRETPGDGTFPFTDKSEFLVRFQNVDEEWGRQWALKSVQFQDSQRHLPIKEISVLELSVEHRQRLNMDWTLIN